MDRRLTPFSGRVGHVSLKGRIADMPLTEGEPARIIAPLAALLAAPSGAVDRHLLYGDEVTVIDRHQGEAFIQAAKDLYCGWVSERALAPARPAGFPANYRVRSPATHLYPEPRVQAPPILPLWLNSRLSVVSISGAWAETCEGFVPASHVAPLADPETDPVTVAELLLNAPYLWGGNSAAGVDCSGLVQLALHACGRPCPGDSDQQQALGEEIPASAALQRGDLLFWKGHVAMLATPDRILHANGYTMSVAFEGLEEAVTRIRDHYGSKILARRRLPTPAKG